MPWRIGVSENQMIDDALANAKAKRERARNTFCYIPERFAESKQGPATA
jgi:hypothetical protein